MKLDKFIFKKYMRQNLRLSPFNKLKKIKNKFSKIKLVKNRLNY